MRQISRLRVAAETRKTPARNRDLTCNTFIKVENTKTPVNRVVTVPSLLRSNHPFIGFKSQFGQDLSELD